MDFFRLTAALKPRQFTHVGYKKLLKVFTAPRANDYSIEYHDHNIIRPNKDQFLDEDKFANPQLTEKFFHPNTLHLYTKLIHNIQILQQSCLTLKFELRV